MGTTRRSTGSIKKQPRIKPTAEEKRLRDVIAKLEAKITHRDKTIERLEDDIKTLKMANDSWRRKFHSDPRIDARGMKL